MQDTPEFMAKLEAGSLTYYQLVNSIAHAPGWEWTGKWWQPGCLVLASDHGDHWEQKNHDEIAPRNTARAACSGHDRAGRLVWIGWDMDVGHGGKCYSSHEDALRDANRILEALGDGEIRRSLGGDGLHVRYMLPDDPLLMRDDAPRITRHVARVLGLRADPTNLGRQVFTLWAKRFNENSFQPIQEQTKQPLELPEIIIEALNSDEPRAMSDALKWDEDDQRLPQTDELEAAALRDWPDAIRGFDSNGYWGTPAAPRTRRGNRNWRDMLHLCHDWGLSPSRGVAILNDRVRHGEVEDDLAHWRRLLAYAKYPRGWKSRRAGSSKPSAGSLHPPLPLEPHFNVPPFPTRVFPEPLMKYCEAVAKHAECPVDLAGQTMLAAISTIMNPRAEVDWGHVEPLGLYLMTAAAPSEHKSTVESEVLRPLRMTERKAREAARVDIKRALAARDILKQKLENAKKKAASNSALEGEVMDLAARLESHDIPRDPRWTLEDVTPETLATQLARHGCLAILSSEGGIVDNLVNRYGNAKNANYKLYLKAWSGDPHQVDRRDREELLERPLLTLGVMCQPETLRELIQNVTGARKLGLLSRFLFSMPRTMVGTRTLDTRPIPMTDSENWAGVIARLAALPSGVMRLSPAARAAQRDHARKLEARMATGGDMEHLADWLGKMQRGQSSRLAAILHSLEVADPYETEISEATMRRALALCQYYVGHALRAFEVMGRQDKHGDADVSLARKILRLCSGRRDVSFSDMTRRFHLRRHELEPTCSWLAELGYLLPDPARRRGRFMVNTLQPVEDDPVEDDPIEDEIAFEQVLELPANPARPAEDAMLAPPGAPAPAAGSAAETRTWNDADAGWFHELDGDDPSLEPAASRADEEPRYLF